MHSNCLGVTTEDHPQVGPVTSISIQCLIELANEIFLKFSTICDEVTILALSNLKIQEGTVLC